MLPSQILFIIPPPYILSAAKAIIFIFTISRSSDILCKHRHNFASCDWTDFDDIWGDNHYHQPGFIL